MKLLNKLYMAQHLIFEGAELAGKSWLMSQVYNHLEPKYNQNKNILDGCHWFNCDIGVYGTGHGQKVIDGYLGIFEELREKNLIVEKLHISDKVYNQIYNNLELDYSLVEDRLQNLDFKIILIKFPEDENILEKRIQDRLNIYPNYKNILHSATWYIEQQHKYIKAVKESRLPSLVVETNTLPDDKLVQDILHWIGEQ
ncbi:hypothetical protein L6270_01710 [Candidatus Parcubacteria bacterium]|nr:hypothetical protein [Patescibacteria group bacterium]MBU4309856.1 hypothetical protein [Patescibacteria group bacterium]MBU4431733.1 hypothetical protein [Patescibacteria group bacterium]MBU4578195.1 hypothetical protein [Patescibacteria group bacterium]MCG2696731.1 hypothetical protein [Candidatus Parcubacteria bacterium]